MHRLAYDQLAKEIGSHFTVDPKQVPKISQSDSHDWIDERSNRQYYRKL